jgi:hypothetical protein
MSGSMFHTMLPIIFGAVYKAMSRFIAFAIWTLILRAINFVISRGIVLAGLTLVFLTIQHPMSNMLALITGGS